MKFYKYNVQEYGFTIMEILVALALSSFLIMGIYHIFSASVQHTQTQTALAEAQENARTAVWILQQAARDVGHIGCRSISPTWQVAQQVAVLPYIPKMLVGQPVYGYFGENNQWLPNLPSALNNKVLKNTDVVVIEKSDLVRAQLAIDLSSTDAVIELDRGDVFATGDIVTISDCRAADLFQISHVQSHAAKQRLFHTSPENKSNHLQQIYSALSEVSVWNAQAFYIGETTRKNQQGQKIYALYRQGLLPTSARVEVVEGIADLRVLYGVSTSPSGPVTQWVTADQLSSGWHVAGLSFILLSQSTENILETPQTYHWLGETIIAPDKRLYRVWQTDVALRNLGIQC